MAAPQRLWSTGGCLLSSRSLVRIQQGALVLKKISENWVQNGCISKIAARHDQDKRRSATPQSGVAVLNKRSYYQEIESQAAMASAIWMALTDLVPQPPLTPISAACGASGDEAELRLTSNPVLL